MRYSLLLWIIIFAYVFLVKCVTGGKGADHTKKGDRILKICVYGDCKNKHVDK